jgi:hypothetical protein
MNRSADSRLLPHTVRIIASTIERAPKPANAEVLGANRLERLVVLPPQLFV